MLRSQHYLRVSPTDVGLNRGRGSYGLPFPAVSPTDVGLNRWVYTVVVTSLHRITHVRGFESYVFRRHLKTSRRITHGRGFES